MTNLVNWQIKQRKAYIFWWCFGLVALIGLTLIFYPSFKDQATQLEQSFSQIPDAAKSFISDTSDFFSPEGYLSSQVYYLVLPMLLSIITIGLGSSLVAKEEQEGSIELLLSKPHSRTNILLQKALSGFSILFIISFVATISTAIICRIVELNVAGKYIVLASFASFIFALTVGSVAFMLSAMGSFGRGMSIGIATVVALGGYILSSLISVAEWLKWPAKALPFYYYKPAEILTGTYDWKQISYYLIVIILCIAISIISFRKRDLN